MRRATWVTAAILCLAAASGSAQRNGNAGAAGNVGSPQLAPASPSTEPQPDPAAEAMRDRMQKAQSSDRQKRMLADADKLLRLATELKAEVDKTTKDEMSLDTIRKAAEVERLAHDIRERMKGQ